MKSSFAGFFFAGMGSLFFLLPLSADQGPEGHNILSPDDTIVALKETTRGAPNILAQTGDFGGIGGDTELVTNAIDDNPGTKYFNKGQNDSGSGGADTGFVVTPNLGVTTVTGIQFATANDLPDRDPLTVTIEGSTSPDAAKARTKDFTLIYEGPTGLEKTTDRNAWGVPISFTNTASYKSYRVLITKMRGGDSIGATQYGEVRLLSGS
jgi:alpha-L-fucosidase 2